MKIICRSRMQLQGGGRKQTPAAVTCALRLTGHGREFGDEGGYLTARDWTKSAICRSVAHSRTWAQNGS
jgi:hypothetical protein